MYVFTSSQSHTVDRPAPEPYLHLKSTNTINQGFTCPRAADQYLYNSPHYCCTKSSVKMAHKSPLYFLLTPANETVLTYRYLTISRWSSKNVWDGDWKDAALPVDPAPVPSPTWQLTTVFHSGPRGQIQMPSFSLLRHQAAEWCTDKYMLARLSYTERIKFLKYKI